MKWLICASMLLCCPAYADILSGHPTVTDGDTYRFESGIRIRLFGVDAPEKNQKCETNGAWYPCGQEAQKFVQGFIGKNELVCELTGDKTYDRFVAICSVGGKDLGEAIIAAGYGFPYREFLKKHRLEAPYIAAEKVAQSKKLGLNRGRFILPADWRSHKMRLECER
jgi:endonuclease YncB( thermonuclease family)